MTDVNTSPYKANTVDSLPQVPEEFRDIAPYDDHVFHEKIDSLVKEPGFEHAVRYVMPDVDYPEFVENLRSVRTQDDFQVKVMGPFLELLAATTTKGVSLGGEDNITSGKAQTFITNHRDIVLDASFLNLCMIRRKLPITQVAIGNNLLIYDWITDLVKINKSFIVKRDIRPAHALEAARQLSGYMHWAVDVRSQSIWIAQREGRAKDSNDRTQESLVKMMSLAGGGDTKENLLALNITPVSISYEFDPNDYLKIREFLLRRRDPEFKKTQRDDLFSMETGILGQKGRVHFQIGRSINDELKRFEGSARNEVIRHACALIDREIHCGYHLYPCNYIAADELDGSDTHSSKYTEADVRNFNDYIAAQMAKVEVSDITADERAFMREMMLTMYANPLRNHYGARECERHC
ncbi:MAG: acyltransferase [Muribaculaceae bacterium]|nr:acyltransferase [Muribaculaceae bacterium]